MCPIKKVEGGENRFLIFPAVESMEGIKKQLYANSMPYNSMLYANSKTTLCLAITSSVHPVKGAPKKQLGFLSPPLLFCGLIY